MADASGQGFTASIVNGTPNYLLADRSVLGQVDGTTGSIQYVKLVWGGSGEANLITDQGSDPTPLPVSLNNSENWFLLDAILDTVKADAGPTAVNVNIVNSTGLCFGNVTLEVAAAVQISGATGAAQGIGSNLGVTFGGITVGPLRVRNFISGSGVTEAIAVTFGNIGGTVNINNLNVGNLNFGASGIAINGWCGGAGVSLPVYIVGGSFSIGSVNANLGSTIGVVLSNRDGSLVGTSGGIFYGLPVVNASGGNPLGVTFSGTPSITGSVNILGTPSFKIDANGNSITGSVNIVGTPSFKIDANGNSITGSVHVLGTPSVAISTSQNTVKIDSNTNLVKVKPETTTTTFANVLTDHLGAFIGYSGGTFFGYPVQIVGGLSLSGLTIEGMTVSIPSSFSITGGTLNAITILGGTFTALNIGNISGGSINVGNFPATQNVKITNASNDPGVVQLSSFNAAVGNATLKDHLDGLGVNVSGLNLSGGLSISDIGATISIAPGLSGSSSKGLGVSFGAISGTVSLPNTQIVNVKGNSDSLTNSPVGISLTGQLKELSAVGICGACAARGTILPSAIFGYSSAGSGGYIPVGMSADALKVSIEGVGLCLGSVTVSGVCFGDGITLIGGTANFLNVQGGTFAVLNIGNISGGTISIGNTVGVTGTVAVRNGRTAGSSLGGPLFVDLVDTDGTSIIKTTGLLVTGSTGMVPIGITWGNSASILVTGGNITIRPEALNTGAGGLSGGGTTFNVILTNMAGVPLGYSGSTFIGIPTQISNIANYGVSGSSDRTLGVAIFGSGPSGYIPVGISGDSLKVSMEGVGITISGFTVDVNLTAIKEVGISGGTLDLLNVQGGTFAVLNISNISGGTISIGNTVAIRPASSNTGSGGMSGGGTTFNTVLTDVYGVPIGHGLSGNTASFVGIPVFGVTGATAVYTQETGSVFGTTGFHSSQPGGACGGTVSFLRISPVRGVDGEPGVTLNGRVSVVGDSDSGIGVTFPSIAVGTITNTVNVSTASGTTLEISGNVRISPLASNTGSGGMSGGGTTFNVILTNMAGVPLGYSGNTFVGLPIFGVSGATAMGVTFGPVSFGTVGMGVTFAGITFATTRTIISGSAFADGGGNLGIPVFGVAGTTAVRVSVEGGTVAGIFVTDAPGITIIGISSGIPVIGVSGGQPIAVTFAAAPAPSLEFPTSGITISSIASGASVTVNGSVGLDSGAIVAVKADTSSGQMPSADQIIAENIGGNKALITMEKRGPVFARGLTIGPFLLSSSTEQPNTIGITTGPGGTTYYYWSTTPYPVTQNYSGPGYEDSGSSNNLEGNPKVNLKQGLYIQLTKWDLVSHVLIGYTAATQFEFDRNAQVLYKEYQVAPIWTHAMDQFRRFPGYTGNNNPIRDNDSSNPYDYGFGGTDLSPAAHKQYIGVIEKPSRIFIPTYDAGKVYIKVKGDYQSHAIGAGFWDQETGQWSDTSLYEREFYASQISGFTANKEPNLTVGGAGASASAEYGSGAGFPSKSIVPYGGAGGNQFPPIQSILNSYAQNPFIRIWGY